MKLILSSLLVAIVFSGCNQMLGVSSQAPQNTQPKWLTDSNYIKGKVSAVGCAGVHMKGKSAQRKLAISRAIEQIAMQKKTTVSTQTYRKSSSNKLGKSETESVQSTNNVTLSTNVVDEYYDLRQNRLCVLVEEK